MLWYKSWREVRWRWIMCAAGVVVLFLVSVPRTAPINMTAALHPEQARAAAEIKTALAGHSSGFVLAWLTMLRWMPAVILPIWAVMLAGAGINTQTTYGMTQGVHGSMAFTLSLPVRRRQLLNSRAGVGLLANVAMVLLFWALIPLATSYYRMPLNPLELAPVIAGTMAGCILFYAVSVLLAVYLDEMWQAWIGMSVVFAANYLFSLEALHRFSPFRLMSGEFYLLNGATPWLGIAACLVAAGLMHLAATVAIERKEF